MKQFAFPKPEHLCLQRDIDNLFSAGSHAMTAFPLRAVYRQVEHSQSGPAVQVLLSVAKRRLHHAVDRNRAKRQLREAYRHNKGILLDALPQDIGLHIAFLWLSDRPVTSNTVADRMHHLLRRIAETLPANSNPPAQ